MYIYIYFCIYLFVWFNSYILYENKCSGMNYITAIITKIILLYIKSKFYLTCMCFVFNGVCLIYRRGEKCDFIYIYSILFIFMYCFIRVKSDVVFVGIDFVNYISAHVCKWLVRICTPVAQPQMQSICREVCVERFARFFWIYKICKFAHFFS